MDGLNREHVLQYVIVPTLVELDMDSYAARALMLGTAMVESGLHWLSQLGDGPALGIWQVEAATHEDIYENFLTYNDTLHNKVARLSTEFQPGRPDVMRWDLRYNCAIARLVYWRISEPLLEFQDHLGLANYYKVHYNTVKGAAVTEEVIGDFEKAASIVRAE